MRVKAKVGITLDREGLRFEAGETCDLPSELAKSWAEQGLVELMEDNERPKRGKQRILKDVQDELTPERMEWEDE